MNLDQYDDSLKETLPAGTVLLKQGTRSGKLYILLEGTLEVKRDETLVAAISEPGALFGEMSALLDIDHTANVIAATPVTVYRFPTRPASCIRTRKSHSPWRASWRSG